LGVVVVGILVAYRIYYMPGFDRSVFARGTAGTFQRALDNRWYISKFYDDFAYKVVYGLAKVSDLFDRYVIDGVVNGLAYLGANTGGVMRKAQSGNVQRYASIIIIGIVVLIFFVLFVLPWGGW
jgi:NADH-quinone oxidoreductase subunit L